MCASERHSDSGAEAVWEEFGGVCVCGPGNPVSVVVLYGCQSSAKKHRKTNAFLCFFAENPRTTQ